MTASIQTEPRTLHTACRPCGNPAWIDCCELCETRARFLAHVIAPLDPEPLDTTPVALDPPGPYAVAAAVARLRTLAVAS